MSDRRKVLIVEDVEDTRRLFAIALEHFGFKTFEAVDGVEGLEQTAAVKPDLIIMDIRMPRMGGLEAMTRLKSHPGSQDIPIVVATANTDKLEIKALRDAGACAVLIKPIDLPLLKQTVERHIRKEPAAIASHLEQKECRTVGL